MKVFFRQYNKQKIFFFFLLFLLFLLFFFYSVGFPIDCSHFFNLQKIGPSRIKINTNTPHEIHLQYKCTSSMHILKMIAIRAIKTRSTTSVDPWHLKVKENDISAKLIASLSVVKTSAQFINSL